MPAVDPVELTAKLVRCASVTPANEGALEVLEELLTGAGFDCAWADRGGIRNLFARWGKRGNGKAFGFNGRVTYSFLDALANRVHAGYEFLSGDDPDSDDSELF